MFLTDAQLYWLRLSGTRVPVIDLEVGDKFYAVCENRAVELIAVKKDKLASGAKAVWAECTSTGYRAPVIGHLEVYKLTNEQAKILARA